MAPGSKHYALRAPAAAGSSFKRRRRRTKLPGYGVSVPALALARTAGIFARLLVRIGTLSESPKLPSPRAALAALVLGLSVTWCAALWVVITNVGEFRLPLLVLWAAFLTVF